MPTVSCSRLFRVVLSRHRDNHDLRHVAGTLAASTGGGTEELMHRLGHATPRAALLYQHATVERDTAIAKAMSDLIRQARQEPSPPGAVPIERGARGR